MENKSLYLPRLLQDVQLCREERDWLAGKLLESLCQLESETRPL